MIRQKEITLPSFSRGFHLITDIVLSELAENLREIDFGICHVFIKHTSASLCINEDADATVRHDMEKHFSIFVPENAPYYKHNYEGSDDMPAHIKAATIGSSVYIPITNGKLNLGTWQGIYLGEHRDRARGRTIVVTLIGE